MIAPVIELPTIRLEGFDAMLNAMDAPRPPEYRHGFVFVPYHIGSTERANYLVGCMAAVFGRQH